MLGFIRDGGYALRAYDKFRRLAQDPDGSWRVSHPNFIAQHRLNAGIIVEATMLDRPVPERPVAGQGRGGVRRVAAARRHLLLRRHEPRGRADRYRGSGRPRDRQAGAHPDLWRARGCRSRPTSPIGCAASWPNRAEWPRFPDDVREWLEVQEKRSIAARAPGNCWSRPSRARGGTTWSPTASRGGTRTSRSACCSRGGWRRRGLKPLGFVASDYSIACYSLDPVTDPAALVLAPISSRTSSSTGCRDRRC